MSRKTTAPAPPTRCRTWQRVLLNLILTAVVLEIGLCIALYVLQVELIFPRHPITAGDVAYLHTRWHGLRDIYLTNVDGLCLQGWCYPGFDRKARTVLLYFGGQEEEISGFMMEISRQTSLPIIGYNYRGTGTSLGEPGEKALCADALAVYDALARRTPPPPQRIVVVGHSLGTGIAVYLARHRSVAGVVLISPYDSIASVGQERFPMVPVDIILKHRIDAIAWAPDVHAPLFALAGDRDIVIPCHHAQRLVAHWGGPATLRIMPNTDPATLMTPEAWEAINRFLAVPAR